MTIKQEEKKKSWLNKQNDIKSKSKTFIEPFEQPVSTNAMDNAWSDNPHFKGGFANGMNDLQANWFASHSFIGYQMCAHIGSHWLVDKACSVPARDALKHGYTLDIEDVKELDTVLRFDRKIKLNKTLKDFIHFGRVYGGQLAMFDIKTTEPDFYENPFNIDGIKEGSYKGIILIDPVDVSPLLTADNIQDPTHSKYLEPTYYLIAGRKYHYTHFVKFVPYPVPKLARHRYNYFGVSVPERVYERVYAAERVANEAPELVMTKRLISMAVSDLENDDLPTIEENLSVLADFRNNYGIALVDSRSALSQLETSLADLDTTIMTQYQLVAAASNVPATKLLETQPKGFNSTGEYEAESYREILSSIQTNDLEQLLDRHYELVAKSLKLKEIDYQWIALDSPTSKEYADIEYIKAQTDAIYSANGAIDGMDIRNRLKNDKESIYFNLEDVEMEENIEEEF